MIVEKIMIKSNEDIFEVISNWIQNVEEQQLLFLSLECVQEMESRSVISNEVCPVPYITDNTSVYKTFEYTHSKCNQKITFSILRLFGNLSMLVWFKIENNNISYFPFFNSNSINFFSTTDIQEMVLQK